MGTPLKLFSVSPSHRLLVINNSIVNTFVNKKNQIPMVNMIDLITKYNHFIMASSFINI